MEKPTIYTFSRYIGRVVKMDAVQYTADASLMLREMYACNTICIRSIVQPIIWEMNASSCIPCNVLYGTVGDSSGLGIHKAR